MLTSKAKFNGFHISNICKVLLAFLIITTVNIGKHSTMYKDLKVAACNYSTHFEELQSMLQSNRQAFRPQNRPSFQHPPPTPTTAASPPSSTGPRPFTRTWHPRNQEQRDRQVSGACFHCGQKGHFVCNFPTRPKRNFRAMFSYLSAEEKEELASLSKEYSTNTSTSSDSNFVEAQQ